MNRESPKKRLWDESCRDKGSFFFFFENSLAAIIFSGNSHKCELVDLGSFSCSLSRTKKLYLPATPIFDFERLSTKKNPNFLCGSDGICETLWSGALDSAEFMEFLAYPYRFSAPSLSSFGSCVERVREMCNFALSAVLGNIFSAIFTFCFALVGTLLGAMTGALIGQETESGFVRGAAVGAISGAVFSIEVFESSLDLWQSDESGIGCLLYLIDVITSLLSGRLVRERIGPAMLSAVQSQMGAVETTFEELPNLFDTGGCKGLPGDFVEKIPKIKITNKNNIDASGEKVSCSVCLQDFQLGETIRSLPQCHHMFHLPCIDKWLLQHGSCPLCRRDL